MAVTQAAAIENVRARIDEEVASFYTDSQIRVWINDGVKEVARRSLWKRTSASVSVTAGTQFYAASTAAIEIYRVEFSPTGSSLKYRLEYRDLNAMDVVWGTNQSIGTGIPELYTLASANPLSIELSPPPSQSGALKVYYYAMPTDLVTSTTTDAATSLDVPVGWEDLPVEWATALAFRKARDVTSYQLALNHFQATLDRLSGLAVRYTDEPTYFAQDYGSYDWGDF